jgi:hypothetical protein
MVKYLILLIVISLPILASAEHHSDSLKLNIDETFTNTSSLPGYLYDSLTNRVIKEYERLHQTNQYNTAIGHSDLNNYLVNPGTFDIENGIWIKEITDDPRGWQRWPELKRLNKRLQEFNDSRADHLRLYVIVSSFKASLESEVAPQSDEYVHKKGLEKYFNEIQVDNILKFTGVELPQLIESTDAAMKAKGYYDRIIYSYAGINFLSPNMVANTYKIEALQILSTPEKENDKKSNPIDQSSKLSIASKAIRSKAKQQVKGATNQMEYVEQVVENIIAAIEIEYDRKEKISGKGITDCGKPIKEIIKSTWPLSNEKYLEAVGNVANIFNLRQSIEYDELNSPFVLVDDIQKFKSKLSDAILPDKGFVRQILPGKLNLMAKLTNHQIYAIFKEVDFIIAPEDRSEFAKNVYLATDLLGQDLNDILLVIPYYSCRDNADYMTNENGKREMVSPILFMPAVYSKDPKLTLTMNSALIREPSLRSGFDQAFKYIPKTYTAFFAYLNWDGSLIFNEKQKLASTVNSNYFDVFIFVDNRLAMIQPHLKCYQEYILARQNKNSGDGKISPPYNPYAKTEYDEFKSCVKASQEAVWKILIDNPEPIYEELNANACNLRQEKFLEIGPPGLAMKYVMASIGKAEKKFWSGVDDYKTYAKKLYGSESMNNDLFYEDKNPFDEDFWLLTALDGASLATSILGLDGFFDGAGGVVALITGDDDDASERFMNIFVPAAIAGGWKIAKGVDIGADVLKAYGKGKAMLLKSKNKIKGVGLDVVDLGSASVNGNLLPALGIHNPQILNATKTNPALKSALEDALVVEKNNTIVKRSATDADDYDFDEIKDRLNNDDGLAGRFETARKTNPQLTLRDHLNSPSEAIIETRKLNDPRMVSNLGDDPATVEAAKRIEVRSGEYNLIVHGGAQTTSDGRDVFWVLRKKGEEWEWVALSHRRAVNYMRGQVEYNTAKRVRVYYCGKSDGSLPQNLANKSGKEVAAPDKPIGVVTSEGPTKGDIVTTDGNEGQWWVFKPRGSNSTPETGGKIRAAKPHEKVLPLGKGIDDLSLSKNKFEVNWERSGKLKITAKDMVGSDGKLIDELLIGEASFTRDRMIRIESYHGKEGLDEIYRLMNEKYGNVAGIEVTLIGDEFSAYNKTKNSILEDELESFGPNPSKSEIDIAKKTASKEAAYTTTAGEVAEGKGFEDIEVVSTLEDKVPPTVTVKYIKPTISDNILKSQWTPNPPDGGKVLEIVINGRTVGVAQQRSVGSTLRILSVKVMGRDGKQIANERDVLKKILSAMRENYGDPSGIRLVIQKNLNPDSFIKFQETLTKGLEKANKIANSAEREIAKAKAWQDAADATSVSTFLRGEGYEGKVLKTDPTGLDANSYTIEYTKPTLKPEEVPINSGMGRTVTWLQNLEKKELNNLPGRPIEILKDTDEKMKAINAFVETHDPGITNLVVYFDKSNKNSLWVYTAGGDWKRVPAEEFGDYTKLISSPDKPVSFKVIPFETNPKDIQSTLEAVARENSKMCFYLPEDPIYLAPYGGTPLSRGEATSFKGIGNINESPRLVNKAIPKPVGKEVLGGTYQKSRFIIKWQDVNEFNKKGPHVFVYMDDKKTLLGDGDLDPDGFLGMTIDIKIPENTSGITGREVFNHIFQEVKKWNTKKQINGVRGIWSTQLPKFRDNIDSFNKKILEKIEAKKANRNLTKQQEELIKEEAAYEAAAETFTGKMAKENDFCCVTEITGTKNANGTYIDADVKFSNVERSTLPAVDFVDAPKSGKAPIKTDDELQALTDKVAKAKPGDNPEDMEKFIRDFFKYNDFMSVKLGASWKFVDGNRVLHILDESNFLAGTAEVINGFLQINFINTMEDGILKVHTDEVADLIYAEVNKEWKGTLTGVQIPLDGAGAPTDTQLLDFVKMMTEGLDDVMNLPAYDRIEAAGEAFDHANFVKAAKSLAEKLGFTDTKILRDVEGKFFVQYTKPKPIGKGSN